MDKLTSECLPSLLLHLHRLPLQFLRSKLLRYLLHQPYQLHQLYLLHQPYLQHLLFLPPLLPLPPLPYLVEFLPFQVHPLFPLSQTPRPSLHRQPHKQRLFKDRLTVP